MWNVTLRATAATPMGSAVGSSCSTMLDHRVNSCGANPEKFISSFEDLLSLAPSSFSSWLVCFCFSIADFLGSSFCPLLPLFLCTAIRQILLKPRRFSLLFLCPPGFSSWLDLAFIADFRFPHSVLCFLCSSAFQRS